MLTYLMLYIYIYIISTKNVTHRKNYNKLDTTNKTITNPHFKTKINKKQL